MQPLYGAQPVPNVPVLVACGALAAYRYTYAPPRRRSSQCRRSSQYRSTFIPLSVSLLTERTDHLFDRVGLASFKSKANAFSLAHDACSHFSSTVFRLSTFSL